MAFGVAAALAIAERDLGRLELPAAAYTAVGLLQLVSAVRFGDQMRWDSPASWIYLAVLAGVVATGAYGWWAGFGHHRGGVPPAARTRSRGRRSGQLPGCRHGGLPEA